MVRRPLRVAALLAVLGLVAAGCVRSERSLAVNVEELGEGETCLTPLEDREPGAAPVELELWHALNAEAKTTLEELAAQFNSEQDDVRVSVRSQGTQYAEVRRAYIQGIASGSLPGLVHTDLSDMQVLIDTNTVRPSQECFDAEGIEPDFIPAVRTSLSSEGTFWPSLATVSTNVMFYNQAQFQKAGLDPDDPPGTLEEVTEAARALKASGVDKPISLLLSPGFVEYWAGGVGEELINNGNGRDALATEATFDNPATLAAFEWIAEMVAEGLLIPFSEGGIDQFLAVAGQQSSMVIETSTASTTIAALISGEDVDTGGADAAAPDLDVEDLVPAAGPFPGLEAPGEAKIGGGAFFIPATNSPEVQAAAWAFSRYMSTEAGQLKWHTEGSYLPIVDGATDDPAFEEFWDSGLAGRMLRVATEQLQGVSADTPGPLVGPREDYTSIVGAALGRVAFQGADPAAAVAQADRELDAALRRYAEDNAG